jgi:aminoglycoside phosphotransferase (APT) family kinase protein
MPSERMLHWAADGIAGSRVAEVRSLRDGGPPWLLRIEHRGGATVAVLRTADFRRIGPFMIRTGAEALAAAERAGLSAPRLIRADLGGEEAGAVATLESVVLGTTAWPTPTSVERLRAAGAALAPVHAVAMAPTKDLRFRPRPIAVDDFAGARRTGRMPTTPLLEAADELIVSHGLPESGTVFVHGDVWPGNIVWPRDSDPVLIDWKTAGVGAPGVDLGELRKQVAIIFGPDAPAVVLDGWERATRTNAEDVGYWDAVAALNTPTEIDDGYQSGGWAPSMDGPAATARRDAFLESALKRIAS